jgi:ABC-type dipeptide/oligopeptide/nickel transport system permease component
MNGVKRFFRAAAVLAAFGAVAVTLTFYVVSRTDELADDRMRLSAEQAPPPEPFGPRYARWLRTVVGSGFADFGQSHTGPVRNVLAERLPVTATIGLASWVLGWGVGLTLAVLFATRWRGYAVLHQTRIYPVAQAVPALVVVILFYLALVQIDPRPARAVRAAVGVLSLVVLMVPATTALWLNGIRRVLDREFVRVARARGLSPFALWRRHVLPNVVVSSGILTQAVFSLAGLVVGSAFVEGVFRLGGVAEAFIEGATRGQAELTGFATLTYFLVIAAGVLLAEGVVIFLDPDGEVSRAA